MPVKAAGATPAHLICAAEIILFPILFWMVIKIAVEAFEAHKVEETTLLNHVFWVNGSGEKPAEVAKEIGEKPAVALVVEDSH